MILIKAPFNGKCLSAEDDKERDWPTMKKEFGTLLDELDEKFERELPSEGRMDKAVKLYEFLFTWGILLLVLGGITYFVAEEFLGVSIPLWGYMVGSAGLAYWLLRHQNWLRF